MSATGTTKPTVGYQEAVKEAAGALQKGEVADWRVAQLTHENTHRERADGNRHGTTTVSMEQWCADVQGASSVRLRFGKATGFRYARIWAKYGVQVSQATLEISFKDAYAEVDGTPDRERMMEYEHLRLVKEGTPEQKAKAVTELLQDPEVVEQIDTPGTPVADVFDRVSVDRPYRQGHLLRPDKVKEIRDNDPLYKGIDAGQALMDLEKAMHVFVLRVAEVFPRVTGMPDRDSDIWMRAHFMRQLLARTYGAADQIKALLDTGKPGGDIDNFLRDVLSDAKEGGEA